MKCTSTKLQKWIKLNQMIKSPKLYDIRGNITYKIHTSYKSCKGDSMRRVSISIVGASIVAVAIVSLAGDKVNASYLQTVMGLSVFGIGFGVLLNMLNGGHEETQTSERISNIHRDFDTVYRYIDDRMRDIDDEIRNLERNCSNRTECSRSKK